MLFCQVVNTGMKVIARADVDNAACNFRLMQEVYKHMINLFTSLLESFDNHQQ